MKFNVDEIFEIAEQLERNGAEFYRKAAQIAPNDHARDLLNSLAAMEDEHERTFAQLRAQVVKEDERREAFYEGDDTAAMYLQAFADTQVFSSAPFEDLKGTESLREILDKAILREKEAIVLFEGMRGSMHQPEDRDRVELIIRQEFEHISMLAEEMKRLPAG